MDYWYFENELLFRVTLLWMFSDWCLWCDLLFYWKFVCCYF